MRSRPSSTSGVALISRIHLLEHLNLAAQRHWVALSDELPTHSLDVSFTLFACSWHCSCLSRVLGSRSLGCFLHQFLGPDPWLFYFLHGPFGTCSIKQLSTSHSEPRLPIHGWIQLQFDACDVTRFRNMRIENTLLADTSLTHSFHTPQSPMSVHATFLHLVRRT